MIGSCLPTICLRPERQSSANPIRQTQVNRFRHPNRQARRDGSAERRATPAPRAWEDFRPDRSADSPRNLNPFEPQDRVGSTVGGSSSTGRHLQMDRVLALSY